MAMQAWQATAYGADGNPGDTISKLVLKNDVPIPIAKDGQVVIKVEFCAINPIDWKLFSGGFHGNFPLTFPVSNFWWHFVYYSLHIKQIYRHIQSL